MKKTKLTPESFTEFISLSQIELNDDGPFCVVHLSRPDITENKYLTSLCVINLETREQIRITDDGIVNEPHWLNDKTLMYKVNHLDDDGTEIVIWKIPGIEVSRAKIPYKISKYIPINERTILALITVEQKDEDFIYTEKIPIWFNGTGFLDEVKNKLVILDLDRGDIELDVNAKHRITDFSFDKAHEEIIVSISSHDYKRPYLSKFAKISLDGQIEYLLDEKEFVILNMSVSNGIMAAKAHQLERGFASHTKLLIVDTVKNEIIHYDSPYGFGLSRRAYHDMRGPFTKLPTLKIRGNNVYFPLSIGGKYILYRFSITKKEYQNILDGEFVIDEYDVSNDEKTIVYIKSDPVTPAEVYMSNGKREHVISSFNSKLRKKYNFIQPLEIPFTASDGNKIDAWLILPKDVSKVPLILNIHGGPKSKFGYSFMFEHQLLATNGFAVLCVNPRGSDGYTEDFADIRGEYGTRDYSDLIEAVKHVLQKFEQLDSENLGVTGISYGGFMTNWIVTQTDLFKAAISQNGISSWEAMYGTTDIGFYFVPDQIGGDILESNNLLKEKSPVYYSDQVKTPILFIHSMEDYRCYIDQALIFHTILRKLGKESAIALFKTGHHTFGWSGKPSARLKRYKLILEWFTKHLKNNRGDR